MDEFYVCELHFIKAFIKHMWEEIGQNMIFINNRVTYMEQVRFCTHRRSVSDSWMMIKVLGVDEFFPGRQLRMREEAALGRPPGEPASLLWVWP